ncbi:MAG TPA: hypothetical protein VGZ23_13835 [bacterium]|nr:hypothetical protein [bacterium]
MDPAEILGQFLVAGLLGVFGILSARFAALTAAAERAAVAHKNLGPNDADCHIRTNAAATRSVKGWLEWLFDVPEPLSGMEGEGLPHEDAHWYEDRIDAGETLVGVRTQDRRGAELAQTLRRTGGHSVGRYEKLAGGWTRFTGEDGAKTA